MCTNKKRERVGKKHLENMKILFDIVTDVESPLEGRHGRRQLPKVLVERRMALELIAGMKMLFECRHAIGTDCVKISGTAQSNLLKTWMSDGHRSIRLRALLPLSEIFPFLPSPFEHFALIFISVPR